MNHQEIAKYLIEKGAKVSKINNNNDNTLHMAVQCKTSIDLLEFIIHKHPDLLDDKNIQGFTALDAALELELTDVVRLLHSKQKVKNLAVDLYLKGLEKQKELQNKINTLSEQIKALQKEEKK